MGGFTASHTNTLDLNRINLNLRLVVTEVGFEPHDLQFMRLTSYRCSTL